MSEKRGQKRARQKSMPEVIAKATNIAASEVAATDKVDFHENPPTWKALRTELDQRWALCRTQYLWRHKWLGLFLQELQESVDSCSELGHVAVAPYLGDLALLPTHSGAAMPAPRTVDSRAWAYLNHPFPYHAPGDGLEDILSVEMNIQSAPIASLSEDLGKAEEKAAAQDEEPSVRRSARRVAASGGLPITPVSGLGPSLSAQFDAAVVAAEESVNNQKFRNDREPQTSGCGDPAVSTPPAESRGSLKLRIILPGLGIVRKELATDGDMTPAPSYTQLVQEARIHKLRMEGRGVVPAAHKSRRSSSSHSRGRTEDFDMNSFVSLDPLSAPVPFVPLVHPEIQIPEWRSVSAETGVESAESEELTDDDAFLSRHRRGEEDERTRWKFLEELKEKELLRRRKAEEKRERRKVADALRRSGTHSLGSSST